MIPQNDVVAIYKSLSEAECAIEELHHSGFELNKSSTCGRDYHTEEHVIGCYHPGERIRFLDPAEGREGLPTRADRGTREPSLVSA